MSSLDGRAPFVIDVRELGRRAGAMMRVTLREPAPSDLANALIEVRAGTPIELELMLESVIDGVLVTGTANAQLRGTCGRCLEQITAELTVEISDLFRYVDQIDQLDPDDELPVLDGDLLDLAPTVRDALVLALPLSPHCREDCLGLCPQCGVRLNDQPAHQHDQTDSRWAALTGIFPADRPASPN